MSTLSKSGLQLEELEGRQLLSATPVGAQFQVNTYVTGDQQTFPQTPEAVAVNPTTGDYVVAWSSQGQNGDGNWDVYFQRYNASGQAQGAATLVDSPRPGVDQQDAAVAMNSSGQFVVTWSGNQLGYDNIFAQCYNADGTVLGPQLHVDDPADGAQTDASVALDAAGDLAITWLGQGSGSWSVYAREYNINTGADTGVFQVSTANSAPSGAGGQPGTALSMDDSGEFVITWTGQQGGQQAVYAQLYSPGGTASGTPIQVSPTGAQNPGFSDVAMAPDGNFVVTWSAQDGSATNVYEQRYNATGGILGSAFQVNTTDDPNEYSAVACDGNGNFVVIWSDHGQDASAGWGVYGQQYLADGLPDGGQFHVNSYTLNDQEFPSVAMTTNGDYVVVWSSNGEDGSGWGVYGQRFVNSGIAVTPTTGLQTIASGTTATFQVVLQRAPQQDVTIPVSSSDPTQGTVSTSTLTFTPSDWNVPQTVTVTGHTSSPYPYFIDLGPAVSTDPTFNGMTVPAVFVNSLLTPQILTSATSLTTTKSGGTATFQVALSTVPVAPVTITLTSSNPAEGSLSQTALVFTSTNWNEPQVVTVTGLNDHFANGSVTYQITGSAQSSDANYNNQGMPPVTVVNQDNVNVPAITVSTTALTTTQAGGSASFTVALTTAPLNNATVTINLGSTNADQGSLSQSTLNFNDSNWNTPQTVQVTGLDDGLAQGTVIYQLTGSASSADAGYDGLAMPTVTVTNQPSNTAGFVVNQTSLVTSQAGGTANFTVALSSQPSATVTLALSTTNASAGVLSQNTLTFTPADWNDAQTVTVVGVNDNMVAGNQPYQIVGTATSVDSGYNNAALPAIAVTNLDTDQAGFTVTPTTLITTKAGGTATFAVALTSIPINNSTVTLNLNLGNAFAGALSRSSLVFTAQNWNVQQTVTVTGLDDILQLGNDSYQITGTAVSVDTHYNNKSMTPLTVTNISQGPLAVSTTAVTTTKSGGTATFAVMLTQMPLYNVTVNLTSGAPSEGRLSSSALLFTPTDWATPQSVTVTGLNDGAAGNVLYQITGTAVSADVFVNGSRLPPINVTNVDTGVSTAASITVTAANPLITTQAGGSAAFTVALSSAPTANVTVYLGSSSAGQGQFPASVTFTSTDWNVPQVVTVQGLNDGLAQAATYQITGVAASSDARFDALAMPAVTVLNESSNTPAIVVNKTSVQLTGEGGTASYQVALATMPTAPVTLQFTSSDPTHGELVNSVLVFDPSDWNQAQTVTIVGKNTLAASGAVDYTITGTATSSDANYHGRAVPTVTVQNNENQPAGFVISPSSRLLVTTQAGGKATFSLALNSAPTAIVYIGLGIDYPSEGSLSVSHLVFTPTDWNVPQSVVVTGENDGYANGGGGFNFSVVGVAISGDPRYDDVAIPPVSFNNADANVPAVVVSPTLLETSFAGSQASFQVALNCNPGTNPVTVNLTSAEPDEGTLSQSSLVFTSADWNVPQTVVVTGLNDGLYNGNQTYQIFGIAQGGGGGGGTNYNQVALPPVTVINLESTLTGIRVAPTALTTTQSGGTGTFQVALLSQPADDVTINLVSGAPVQGSLSTTSLTFTPANWSTPQSVVVTGLYNPGTFQSQTYEITGTSQSSDSNYDGLTLTPVTVTNLITAGGTSTTIASSDQSSVYGQDITLTATVTPIAPRTGTPLGSITFYDGSYVLGTVVLSGGTARLTTGALSAGTHDITASYSGNHAFATSSSGDLTQTVTPAPLTVAADNASRPYGAANPTFAVSYTGFVNGDDASSLSGSLSFATTATPASPSGAYAITPSGLSSNNYTITFDPGQLLVTPATLTVTADNESKVYGASNPALAVSYSGFVNGDTSSVVSGMPLVSTTATASSGVGAYPIAVGRGSLSAANYTFLFVAGTLRIDPAPLLISVGASAKVAGEPNPAFTAHYMGLVNGDTSASLNGTLSFTTPADAASPAGVYAVTPGGVSSPNYAIVFAPGTLTVAQARLSADAAPLRATAGQTLQGAVASFADTDTSATASDFMVGIDWGNGSHTTGTVTPLPGGGFAVVGAEQYVQPGTYQARITIADRSGASTSATALVTVVPASTDTHTGNGLTFGNPVAVVPAGSGSSPPLLVPGAAAGSAGSGAGSSAGSGAGEGSGTGSGGHGGGHGSANADAGNAHAGPPPAQTQSGPAAAPAAPAAPAASAPAAPTAAPPQPLRSSSELVTNPTPPLQTAVLAQLLDEFQPEREDRPANAVVKIGLVTGVVGYAGYLLLSARASYWLLTLVLARPLVWKRFDAMEVLFAWEKDKKRKQQRDAGAPGAGESLQSLVQDS